MKKFKKLAMPRKHYRMHNLRKQKKLELTKEIKEARELCELELKAEKEKALLAAKLEAAAFEHELKMASLGKHSHPNRASVFDPARNIRLLPPFQEKEVDKYLLILRKLQIV